MIATTALRRSADPWPTFPIRVHRTDPRTGTRAAFNAWSRGAAALVARGFVDIVAVDADGRDVIFGYGIRWDA